MKYTITKEVEADSAEEAMQKFAQAVFDILNNVKDSRNEDLV